MDKKELYMSIAKQIYLAEKNATPITPVSDQYKDLTIEDAYAIQLEVINLKLQDGERIVGKKIGLTNKAIRDQIGVHEPDYGILTDHGVLMDGDDLDTSVLIAPRIEPEIAFILDKDITKDMYPVSTWDIIDATRGIAPALEIVDSRVKDWKIKIVDTISDSASYSRVVLGNKITKLDNLDLRVLGMTAYKNGEIVCNGSSSSVMGNPINAVTWLANKLLGFGVELKKGEIILSGSFTPVFHIKAGDNVNVLFDHLGEVSLNII